MHVAARGQCDDGEFGNLTAFLPGNQCCMEGRPKGARAVPRQKGTGNLPLFQCKAKPSFLHSTGFTLPLGCFYGFMTFMTFSDKDPASAGYLEILTVQVPGPELILWNPCTANRDNHLDLLPCYNPMLLKTSTKCWVNCAS